MSRAIAIPKPREKKEQIRFFLVWLNDHNNNSVSLGIIYSHSNHHSYGIVKSLIRRNYFQSYSSTAAAGKIEDKAISEDWTGLRPSNWGLVGHLSWQIICLFQENVFFLQYIYIYIFIFFLPYFNTESQAIVSAISWTFLNVNACKYRQRTELLLSAASGGSVARCLDTEITQWIQYRQSLVVCCSTL